MNIVAKGTSATEMEEILNGIGIHPDKVHKSKKYKNYFVARFGFFYRHGQDAHYWARKIKEGLEEQGFYIPSIFDAKEVWQAWPKDSYWEVIFTIR